MADDVRVAAPDFERSSVPDSATRASLLGLLGAHAIPVWGWGQRAAYERMVMAGPGLDQWVRTAGLWAEMERMLWEWEQLVAGITPDEPDPLVTAVAGDLSVRTVDAGEQWIDLMLRAASLDALGEHLVRTTVSSSYAPLQRHARTMVAYKRGQAADGCDALRDVIRLQQLDADVVRGRVDVWRGLTRDHASRVAALHAEHDWDGHGLATELDVDAAIAAVDARLDRYLEG